MRIRFFGFFALISNSKRQHSLYLYGYSGKIPWHLDKKQYKTKQQKNNSKAGVAHGQRLAREGKGTEKKMARAKEMRIMNILMF